MPWSCNPSTHAGGGVGRQLWRRCWHSPVLSTLLLGHVVYAVLLGARALDYLEPLELGVYDRLLQHQAQTLPPDPRISIVWCNDADQRRWGWPISDEVLVRALEQILQHQPAVVGLDLYRDLPVPMQKTEAYARLQDLFSQQGLVYGIMKLSDTQGSRVDAPPALAEADRVGFNDLPVDYNGIVRRGLLFMDDGERYYEYFGLKLARHYLARDGLYLHDDPVGGGLKLGDTPLAPPLGKGIYTSPPGSNLASAGETFRKVSRISRTSSSV